MASPENQTDEEIHNGTRTLQEIADAVAAEREERKARQDGFGKGMKHLGVDNDPDGDTREQPKIAPLSDLPGSPQLR